MREYSNNHTLTWPRRLLLISALVAMCFLVLGTSAFADLTTPSTETYTGRLGTYPNTFYIYDEDQGGWIVAYCFNYNFGFYNNDGYHKVADANAEDMNKYSGLTDDTREGNDPVTDDATVRDGVLKAVYNGYPNDSSNILEESGLQNYSDSEYYFRLATQCAVWHWTDGAEIDDMLSSVLGIANLTGGQKDAFVAAYNMLIDEDLTYPSDYALDLYVYEYTSSSGSSVQNLLSTRSTTAETVSDTRDIQLTKTWENGNFDGSQPTADEYLASLHVIQSELIYSGTTWVSNGTSVDYTDQIASDDMTCTDNGDGTYTVTFSNLPKDDGSSVQYEYTIEEDSIDGYTAGDVSGDQYQGFTLTNTYNGSVSVQKVWEGTPGESAVVDLLANGEVVDTVELNEDNNWEYTFSDLDCVDSDGNAIEYTVQEQVQDGYTTTITGDMNEGFVITNTAEAGTVTKVDNDNVVETGDPAMTGVGIIALISAAAAAGALAVRRKAR